MIEQFHGEKGLYKADKLLDRAVFYHASALDEIQTMVIIADPKASAADVARLYGREEDRLKNEKISIKIAAAGTETAGQISRILPLADVFDGEKGRWRTFSGGAQ